MLYRLADHGLVFSTRDRGARILGDLRAKSVGASKITIDFSDVRSVSHSFIDEFVGELMQDAVSTSSAAPTFVNVPQLAARTIERTVRRRGLDADRACESTLEAAWTGTGPGPLSLSVRAERPTDPVQLARPTDLVRRYVIVPPTK
jgi:hypothetical protein